MPKIGQNVNHVFPPHIRAIIISMMITIISTTTSIAIPFKAPRSKLPPAAAAAVDSQWYIENPSCCYVRAYIE